MTTDRDDAPVRRYREASAALDERPSAGTRAAILAAAARQVEAKPQAADAPRAVRRRRWPLAAAAAVLLSTLVAMLATRTEQEMPTFTAPVERVPEPAMTAPSSSVPAEAPAALPAPSVRVPERAPTEAARAAGQAADGAATPRSRKAAPIAAPEARESAAASAEARSALPAAAPPTAARPASAPSPAGASGAAGLASDAARSDAPAANRLGRKELAPAPAVQGAVSRESAREFEHSAPDWLDRIVKLRGEGRQAEADAELKRFRERYPDVQVPLSALPPAGAAPGTR